MITYLVIMHDLKLSLKKLVGLLIFLIGVGIILWVVYNQFFPTDLYRESPISLFRMVLPAVSVYVGWRWLKDEGKGIDEVIPPELRFPELEEAALKSKETIGDFLEVVEKGVDGAYVKFPLKGPSGGIEHIWAYVHFYRDEGFNVSLDNALFDETQDDSGRLNVPLAEVEDWQLVDSQGKIKGAYSLIACFKYWESEGNQLTPLMRKQRADLLDAPALDATSTRSGSPQRLTILVGILIALGGVAFFQRYLRFDDFSNPSSGETPRLSQQRSGPVSNIDAQERLEATKLQKVTSPLKQELKVMEAKVRGAFDERNFAVLEEQAKHLRSSGEVLADGSWKIQRFYNSITENRIYNDAGFMHDLRILEQWEKAYPDSLTRRACLADFLMCYAWFARGNGYSHTVTPEGWRLFDERLNYAEGILKQALRQEDKDPYVYEVYMRVAKGLKFRRVKFEKIINESKEHFPTYYPAATARANSLLPRWYGKDGDWEMFARVFSQSQGQEDNATYARIVLGMHEYYNNMFSETRVDKKAFLEGLHTLNETYPDSVELWNYTAFYLVVANDLEQAQVYFDKMGETYSPVVWDSPEYFCHFRTKARTGKW